VNFGTIQFKSEQTKQRKNGKTRTNGEISNAIQSHNARRIATYADAIKTNTTTTKQKENSRQTFTRDERRDHEIFIGNHSLINKVYT
jgi:hypothetical protein